MAFARMAKIIFPVAVVAVGFVIVPVVPIAAAASESMSQALPPQPLVTALETFARNAGLQLVYGPEITVGLQSPGAEAGHSIEDTLRELLRGTGLTFEFVNERTVTLLVAPLDKEATDEAQEEEGPKNAIAQTQLAQNGMKPLAVQEERRAGQAGLRESASSGDDSQSESEKDISEIHVKSRRPFTDANVDIVRTENDPQAYYIFKGEEVEKANVARLEDFFSRVTMVAGGDSYSKTSGGPGFESRTLNLRGLGNDQTLILINGRRVAGFGPFDVNPISPTMVERIEVIPSSASAIYGGSAVGGVINIILKRDFTGGEFRVGYDSPLDANAPNTLLSGTYGWSFNAGRTNVTISGSYQDFDALTRSDRSRLLDGYLARVAERAPGLLYAPNSPYLGGSTPNIASANGSPLILDDGTALGSPLTYVPAGTSNATPLSQLYSGLAANAGRQNLTSPNTADYSNGQLRSLTHLGHSKAALAAVRHKLTDRLELFAEGFYAYDHAWTPWTITAVNRWTIPGGAATNPFQQDVVLTIPSAYEAASTGYATESARGVAGGTMDLPHEWRAQADFTWNRKKGSILYGFFAGNGVPLRTDLTSGVLNPFVDTLANPLDWERYEGRPGSGADVSTLKDFGFRVSGPIGNLPAGRPNLTVGLGHRTEALTEGFTDFPQGGLTTLFPLSQRISSVYAEALLPLVSPENAIRGVRVLELQLASRLEDFKVDTGTASRFTVPPNYTIDPNEQIVRTHVDYKVHNNTVGLRFQPMQVLTLRASYSQAFLPPTFNNFVRGPVIPAGAGGTGSAILDPRRGNELLPTPSYQGGGNENIQPMDATTWNVGFIVEPTSLPGVRLGAEWFRIQRENLIFSPPNIQFILNNESLYADRVVRAAPTPGDPFGVGRVTFVDLTVVNTAHVSMEGVDLSIGYRKSTGRLGTFNVDLISTIVDRFTRVLAPGQPEIDTSGQVGTYGYSMLKVRANAALGWERGPWSAQWSTRHYGPYEISRNPLHIAAQGGTTVPHQVYHDLLATYRFQDSAGRTGMSSRILANLEVSLGVRNVFKKNPPFDASEGGNRGGSWQYVSGFGDTRLRSVQLSVAKRFD